jgi:uncharacterized protein (DUF2336 family)
VRTKIINGRLVAALISFASKHLRIPFFADRAKALPRSFTIEQMTQPAYAAQIEDLEDAIVRCPDYRRALVLQQVIHLFLDGQREAVGKLNHFDDVLVCLLRPATAVDLAKVSSALVRSGLKLPKAIRLLAHHRDASVASPILRHSTWIFEDDLTKIAETRELAHLLAMGSRSILSEYLTTTLIMRGYTAVHALIACNSGARLSEAGFSVLLKIAERDHKLAGSLGARSDIPPGLLRKFLAIVADKPRAAFLRAAPTSVKVLATRETPAIVAQNRDYSIAEKEISELRRTGKLNDPAFNRFAVMQQIEKLTVALALASETSVKSVERLLCSSSEVDRLVITCKASRVRWPTTAAILNNRQGCAPLERDELKALGELFESLSLSEAQRTIRFGPTTKQ